MIVIIRTWQKQDIMIVLIVEKENVMGYHCEDNFTKGAKLFITGCTAVAGALIAGPLGFMAGLGGGKLGSDKLSNMDDRRDYKFRCPRCGHEFTRWFDN